MIADWGAAPDHQEDLDTMLTVAQAAARAGVDPQTIRRWTRRSRHPLICAQTRTETGRPGHRRIRLADLDAFTGHGVDGGREGAAGAGAPPLPDLLRQLSDSLDRSLPYRAETVPDHQLTAIQRVLEGPGGPETMGSLIADLNTLLRDVRHELADREAGLR